MKLPDSAGDKAPRPVTEDPGPDRECDLVLTGGVASGVVYPWAVVELARHFQFRNIGGTSVGAMAAVLTAAAEYGRRQSHPGAFEPLRYLPAALGEDVGDGRTRMLSLFQPSARGRRLFGLFERAVRIFSAPSTDWYSDAERAKERCPRYKPKGTAPAKRLFRWKPKPPGARLRLLAAALWAFRREALVGALTGATAGAGVGLLLAALLTGVPAPVWLLLWGLPVVLSIAVFVALAACLAGIGGVAGTVCGLLLGVRRDIELGMVRNGLGLCTGATVPPGDDDTPGLVQWLHEAVQRSAGLPADRPLTFRNLWEARAYPGGPQRRVAPGDSARSRSINLEMITSNVTHGRPYRLPHLDDGSRLFFRPAELKRYFPAQVMKALVDASVPYAPRTAADPAASPAFDGCLELPGADLPVVVAARLSLSYPLLFSAVPLYAIDHEPSRKSGLRRLERCWFSDGGLCSNFPVHLFDAAVPRRPTFGMWLGKRSPYEPYEPVWLPTEHQLGRGDMRQRFDPLDWMTPMYRGEPKPRGLAFLGGFLLAAAVTAKDWVDRTAIHLPHVRSRVAQLGLLPGEGELNIAMPREQILQMAGDYGLSAARKFIAEYVSPVDGSPTRAWCEQRWQRLQVLTQGLSGLLDGFAAASRASAEQSSLDDAIDDATLRPPLGGSEAVPLLSAEEARQLKEVLARLRSLETEVVNYRGVRSYRPTPASELRVRPPL